MTHPLHRELGKKAINEFGSNVLLDPACGKGHNLPLFSSEEKLRETEFCDVDMLVLKGGEVKVIFEIEESNIKPTQICGKMLTAALSKYYIYKDKKYPLSSSIIFIQVVDTSKLKNESKKIPQFENLGKAIQEDIRFKNDRIISYKLYLVKGEHDKEQIDNIFADAHDFLK